MKEIEEQEIDLTPYVKKVLRNWKTILLWAFIAAVIGFGVSKSIPKEYTVVSKVSPELSYRTNSLSSLASLAGVNLNMLNNTDALLPTVYPDIVNTIPFMTSLFDMPVEVKTKTEVVDTTLYAYLRDYTRTPWWGAVLGAPMQAIVWARGLFSEEGEEEESTVVDKFHLTKEQNAMAKMLCRRVKAVADKKTFVITITATLQDPVIAAQVAQKVTENLKDYVTAYRTDKAKLDVDYFRAMFEDAEREYYDAQKAYSWYLDSHQGFVLQSAKVEQQRLQNEVNLKSQLYNSLAQQLQNAEAKVQQETPVFAEILPPTVPLKKSKPITKKIMLALFVLGAMAGTVRVLVKKEEESEEA